MDRDQLNKPEGNKDAAVKPDQETLHTTDPQENMHGPVSNLIKNAGQGFESSENKQEADRKKDERL